MNARDANRGRQRAQRLFAAKECTRCGRTDCRLERHHIDGNPLNNDTDNVRVLCTRCHMIEDGRLEVVADRLRRIGHRAKPIYKGTVCTVPVCERPAKYKGLCNSHYYRALRNGGVPGTEPVREYRRVKQ